MTLLSTLRVFSIFTRKNVEPYFRGCLSAPSLNRAFSVSSSCNGGGSRKMVLTPSRFEWTEFKDNAHFYLMLGIVPIATLILLVNVFIGSCELREIPDNYEPKHWEYFKHPIEQWFSRYVYDHPAKEYEKMLHQLNVESRKREFRALEKKVRRLMAERGDYKGWYYLPVNAERVYKAHHHDKYHEDHAGGRPI